MKEYLNYSEVKLRDYVINSLNKEQILSDNEFKNYLLEEKNHYAFVWLVQDLNEKNAQILIDNEYMEKIIDTDKKSAYKFNAILCSKGDLLLNASDKVIKYILEENYLNSFLSYLSKEVTLKLLDYIISKDSDKINMLAYFGNCLEDILNTEKIEKLGRIKGFDKVFFTLSPSVILKLLKIDMYKDLVCNLNMYDMLNFSTRISSVSIQNIFLDNNRFLLNVATIENPNYYRNIIDNLSVNNYLLVDRIEKYRKIYIESQFKSEENGIFSYYTDLLDYINTKGIDSKIYDKVPVEFFNGSLFELTDEKLRQLTFKRKFEMLCDLYFKDYARNVLFNLKEIMRAIGNKDIIPMSRKTLYNKFLHFNELSNEEINGLLLNATSSNYSELLYDDIRTVKEVTYNSYNDQFLKLNKDNKIYNKDLSDKYNVDIYMLSGEPFLACVHCGAFTRTDFDNETISLSLIGTENTGVYSDNNLILGFDYLNPNRIMHVYNRDSATSGKYGTNVINKIYDGHELLKQTSSYNEILYKQKDFGNLVPSFVVCFNDIDERSYNYALNNKLPIVVIDSKKYNQNERLSFDMERYQTSYDNDGGDYFAK